MKNLRYFSHWSLYISFVSFPPPFERSVDGARYVFRHTIRGRSDEVCTVFASNGKILAKMGESRQRYTC